MLALWQKLPEDGFLTSADLAAWMNTEQQALASTPAAYAHASGGDDALLDAAVSRLRARAA